MGRSDIRPKGNLLRSLELAADLNASGRGGLRLRGDSAGNGNALGALEEVAGVGEQRQTLSRGPPGAAVECELRDGEGTERQSDVREAGAVDEFRTHRRHSGDGECTGAGHSTKGGVS